MKKSTRWSIRKITVATAAAAVACPILAVVSRMLDLNDSGSTTSAPKATLSLSTFLLMLSILAGMLAVLSAIWLIARIREARTPAWKRKTKKKRL